MTTREAAHAIWRAALAAGSVGPLLQTQVRRDKSRLQAGTLAVDLDRVKRVIVLGCGKASGAMARTLEDLLGDRITRGLVVVKDGHRVPTRTIRVVEAGHPVPDERGAAAASQILALATSAERGDLVIVLISGGGSALMPAPVPPITLEEKQKVTRALMTAGATIHELNAVRKHLSFVKGGQLARAAAPATILTLALSDVIGDALDVIASGPTAPDATTFADALEVLRRRGGLDNAPAAVRARLEAGVRGELAETPKAGDPIFDGVTNLVVANNHIVVDAAAAEARRLGYESHILTYALEGEARDVARDFVGHARTLGASACLIAGGETTVTARGHGRGGRCQEFALAAALALPVGAVVLAAGTDGTDGPTDAAGAVVDVDTLRRGKSAGVDPEAALHNNDSYTFMRASGDVLVTGPTYTNLLDLYLFVPPRASSVGELL